jgi:ATP phosphoribosyltransferase
MNPWDKSRIKFALPTKGRLKDPSIELLKKSGYNFRTTGRNLYATCLNEDIVFIFVRADDIPVLVDSGVIDIGITGSDLILERGAEVEEILKLNFGKCRLCVAVRENISDKNLSFLQGKTVVTSFPATTTDYFKKNSVNVKCVEMNGSVEIMIALNLADAIVDLVETGDSLRDNNLKIFSEIGSYQAVLISSKNLKDDPRVLKIKRRIDGILVANQYSMLEYNIKTDLLKKAESIAPGFESPTVSALDEKGWSAVKVMVKKNEIVQVMDRLAELGATAILETEILNCRL